MRTVRTVSLLVAVAAALTACSSAGDGRARPTAASSRPAAVAASRSPDAATVAMAGHGAHGASVPADPTEAALRLQALVGQHSILASDLMRSRIRGDADLAEAADVALRGNTEDIGALLGSVVGEPGRARFDELWSAHVASLFDYARGLAAGDAAVRSKARADLVRREDALATLFAGASHGRLPRAAAFTAVKMHIDHLLEAADAYQKRDYATAARLYRTSYGHTYDLGSALAHALLPPSAAARLDRPDVRLRSALTKLLGEHVALVVAAMRSSVGDKADFAAMGDAVNGNTVDLTGAIDSLFGSAAAQGFQSRWADHVDELMAYTTAVVQHDPAGREQARGRLRTFEQSFAEFLDGATEHRLGRPALAQAFVMHDRALLAEIDAYSAEDYPQAYDLSVQTYDDMFTMSGQLAAAIGATLGSRLPTGGSQTGGGGTAPRPGGR